MELSLKEDLPRRDVVVNGETYSVPRHVVRIDITGTPSKPKKSHGWQVRYRGQTKYFKDGESSPEVSLAQAECYLHGIYYGPSVPFKVKEYSSKNEKVGTSGIRITRLNKALGPAPQSGEERKRVIQVYVEVNHPLKGMPPRRLYVGTASTASEARIQERMVEAKAHRQKLEQDFIEFREVVPAWSERNTPEHFRTFLASRST